MDMNTLIYRGSNVLIHASGVITGIFCQVKLFQPSNLQSLWWGAILGFLAMPVIVAVVSAFLFGPNSEGSIYGENKLYLGSSIISSFLIYNFGKPLISILLPLEKQETATTWGLVFMIIICAYLFLVVITFIRRSYLK